MDKLRIHGPARLEGSIRASGAKNAALPLLTAALLTNDEPLVLENVPQVRDIRTMRRLLEHLGVEHKDEPDGGVTLQMTENGHPDDAPYELVKTMRASVLVLGPLLARRGRARVSLPGGCAIGVRPVNLHLLALEALGAEVRLEHGYIEARADRLVGTRFRFPQQTVGGTENALLAASLAKGTTVLENCAREPEIVDLAVLLNSMGAGIEGAGTPTITIEGQESLRGTRHDVLPDRIEAGTYLIGGVMTCGDVTVEGARADDLKPLLENLETMGASVERNDTGVRVRHDGGPLVPHSIVTEPHPGFPTDLQAQYMALSTQAEGQTIVAETVFENRFQHVSELQRLGANISIDGRIARVDGPSSFSGANVMATDLRASACLVLAALIAEGETVVDRVYHLDRGYADMEGKLRKLGARVERFNA